MTVLKGFKNFLVQGDLIVIVAAALAFSSLIKPFTDNVITALINAADGAGARANGLGWTINGQRIDMGASVSAIFYCNIFMAIVYIVLAVRYQACMRKRGATVFDDPTLTKTCPSCLSVDLALAATKCEYCGSEMRAAV